MCGAGGVGCGGDDEEAAGSRRRRPEQAEPVTLKVGVIPITDVAPLYLGVKKGFFEEENLTIEPQLAEGGAAIIPSVMSGDYQIGFSNAVSLLIAASKDLPVQIISQGVLGGTTQDDAWDSVVVPKGSDVKTAKDLEGKTIAVNTLNNIGPVTINNALEKAGADYKKIKYVEVPFPEMGAALEAKRVDAAFTVEPAYSGAVAAGGTPIFSSYVETAPNLTVATYFASKQYIAENGDVVAALQARDGEVARVRGAKRGRGARGGRRVHADPGRGDRQDAPADLEGRPQRAHDPDRCPTCRSSTASSRSSRRWMN